jgi:prophage antirepressor-like protein
MGSALALALDYDGRQVRMAGTPAAPRFVAADVCGVLGYGPTRVTEVLSVLDEDEKGYDEIVTPGGPQSLLTVTEPGLYKLISRSRKPAARRFDRWVRHDVIPCIRQHGCYPAPALADVNGSSRVVVYRDPEVRSQLADLGVKVERLEVLIVDGFEQQSAKLDGIARGLPVVRREFTAADKRRMGLCVVRYYRKACPGCQGPDVVNDDGDPINGAEFDHWRNRNDNSPESGWLVCRRCNEKLKHAGHVDREAFRPAFTLYQQRLKSIAEVKALRFDPRQRSLFDA